MVTDLQVKHALYQATARAGRVPTAADLASRLEAGLDDVRAAFARIAAQRLLVLEPDGLTIRMAPPFSGVPTQHVVRSGGIRYFANCAWDALGIVAALRREGEVHSRCEQSNEPLRLRVGREGPEPSDWLFHCEIPAARWWEDIVYT